MLPTMTAGALPPSRSARARLAAAATAAVVVATAVVAGLPGAAAQGPELVTGLVRGRGFPVVGAPNERIIGGRNVTLNDAEYGGGLYVLGRSLMRKGELQLGGTGKVAGNRGGRG